MLREARAQCRNRHPDGEPAPAESRGPLASAVEPDRGRPREGRIGSESSAQIGPGGSGIAPPEERPNREPIGPELAQWLVLFLVPSLGVKYLFLTELYGSTGGARRIGLFSILDSMAPGAGWIGRLLRLGHLLCVDVLEVSLGCAALFLVARFLLPRHRDLAMAVVLFCALLLIGANVISVRQLGALLTAETLSIAYDWTRGHPSALLPFVSLQKIVGLAAAGLWAAAPWLAGRIPSVKPLWQGAWRRLAPIVLAAAAIGAVLGLTARLSMTHSAPRAFGGFWSSAIASLRGAADPGPCVESPASAEQVAARYRRLVFPAVPAAQAPTAPLVVTSGRTRPRHVIVVVLETAPRKYYSLADDPTLPTFHRMAKTALVGDRHYATVPFTKTSIFSILSGTYPRDGRGLHAFGDFETDSLPTVLRRRGYETSFVDSYKIDWQPGRDDRRMWRDLGFDHLLDGEQDAPTADEAPFEVLAEGERRSFEKALTAVVGAEERGRKAFVLVATAIGHHDWRARAEDEGLPAPARIHRLAEFLDGLLADLLRGLSARALGEQVLIVVTGDHGLRYGAEFASLGEAPEHGDAEFNVPFLLYAPGLIDGRVDLPHVTSHVDIAPTVLFLLGMDDPSLLHHGTSMTDPRLAERTTFMLDANLSPIGGLHRSGIHYTVNHLTGVVTSRRDAREAGRTSSPLADSSVEAALDEAGRIFDATDCLFLRRASGGSGPTGRSDRSEPGAAPQ